MISLLTWSINFQVFTAVDGYVVTAKGYKKKVDILDLSFADHRAAFKSKSTWDIIRALVVFNLCSIRPLVEHNAKVSNGNKTIWVEALIVFSNKTQEW